jgi:hypothetical protein
MTLSGTPTVPTSLQHLLPSPGHFAFLALLPQSGQGFAPFEWQSSIAALAGDLAEANAAPAGAVATASPISTASRRRNKAMRSAPQLLCLYVDCGAVKTLSGDVSKGCARRQSARPEALRSDESLKCSGQVGQQRCCYWRGLVASIMLLPCSR